MMGFYLCLALLAALSAGSDGAPHTRLDVLKIVWATTVGLALAHWFAVSLSARLVHDPDLHHTSGEIFGAQTVMAVMVALVATGAVLVSPIDLERLAARATAALFIGVLVGVESRAGAASARRSLMNGLLALAGGLLIAITKWYISR